MDKTLFCELNNKVSVLFESEPAVVHVDIPSIILVGDLHGNLDALEFILKMGKKLNCSNYIFLGDYVDRGDHSVEVLCRLFKLKIENPDGIILLRGNHETAGTNAYYGLYDDLDKDDELFALVNRTFEKMPVAAVLNGNVFCVHGGISDTANLDQIKKENCYPYLWNDPQADKGMNESLERWGAKVFGPDICDMFLKSNNLDMIVRAHTELMDGCEWWFDGKLLSLFSTPYYCGLNNDGAFAFIEHDEWKTLDEEMKTFVFGRSEDASYSLLKVVSHNSEIFEFYDSENDSTISIVFNIFMKNNILVSSYYHGDDDPRLKGAVIVDEYTFTEPNAIEKVIIECRLIETASDLGDVLDRHPHVCEQLLVDV